MLNGAGTFNLAAPIALNGITTIDAYEGQAAFGAVASTQQILRLRSGMSATVNVLSDPAINPANPNAPGIIIYGANDSDVINLGGGTDIVTLGSASETVNGGAGLDTIYEDNGSQGATINGGAHTRLNLTGGGTIDVGANVSNVPLITMMPAKYSYVVFAGTAAGETLYDESTGYDVLLARGANQTLAGGAPGKVLMIGFVGGGTTFKDSLTAFNGDGILYYTASDRIDITGLAFDPKTVSLAYHPSGATEGTLEVRVRGVGLASIQLSFLGAAASFFTAQSDGAGGTLILDPPAPQNPVLAGGH
jgi:hypothetical protein